jgi:hypothetical protein
MFVHFSYFNLTIVLFIHRLLITPVISSHFSYPVSSYSYNKWQILDKIVLLLVLGLQVRW